MSGLYCISQRFGTSIHLEREPYSSSNFFQLMKGDPQKFYLRQGPSTHSVSERVLLSHERHQSDCPRMTLDKIPFTQSLAKLEILNSGWAQFILGRAKERRIQGREEFISASFLSGRTLYSNRFTCEEKTARRRYLKLGLLRLWKEREGTKGIGSKTPG